MASAALSLNSDATHRVFPLPPFKEKLRMVSLNIAMEQGNLAFGNDIKIGGNVALTEKPKLGSANEKVHGESEFESEFVDLGSPSPSPTPSDEAVVS